MANRLESDFPTVGVHPGVASRAGDEGIALVGRHTRPLSLGNVDAGRGAAGSTTASPFCLACAATDSGKAPLSATRQLIGVSLSSVRAEHPSSFPATAEGSIQRSYTVNAMITLSRPGHPARLTQFDAVVLAVVLDANRRRPALALSIDQHLADRGCGPHREQQVSRGGMKTRLPVREGRSDRRRVCAGSSRWFAGSCHAGTPP